MRCRTAFFLLLFNAPSLLSDQLLEKEEIAQRLWEQMISAKGGRERIRNVHTVLQREVPRYRSITFRDGKARWDTLYGLPDRFWEWYDSRIFGFWPDVSNFKQNVHYFRRYDLTYMDPANPNGRGLDFLRRIQLIYLNQTDWLKPQPIRVLKGLGIPRNVDAIQTMADGARADFYLNRRTHLPAAIIDYRGFALRNDPSGGHRYVLSHYELINGILTPTDVDGELYEIAFNPVYREDTFTTAAYAEEGPEGWTPDKAAIHKALLEQHPVIPVPQMHYVVEPSSGSGTQQTFRLTATRSDGVDHIKKVGLEIGIGQSLWCFVEIDLRNRQLALKNTTAEIDRSPKHRVFELTGKIGSQAQLENEDCHVELSNVSASIDSGKIQVTLPLTFKPALAGKYWITCSANTEDQWVSMGVKAGTWSVPSSPQGPQGVDWTEKYR
jgi:hypothetical protein